MSYALLGLGESPRPMPPIVGGDPLSRGPCPPDTARSATGSCEPLPTDYVAIDEIINSPTGVLALALPPLVGAAYAFARAPANRVAWGLAGAAIGGGMDVLCILALTAWSEWHNGGVM